MALPTGDVVNAPTDAELYEVGTGDIFSTTLAADITATSPGVGGTLELASTTNLSTNGLLLIPSTNELIRYEGIDASPVGVVVKERGFGSTTAAAASTGDAVWLVVASYYHDLLAAYVKEILTGNRTFTGLKIFNDHVVITGTATAPTSGAGIDLRYGTGVGFIYAYDWDTTAYKKLNVAGDPLELAEGATVLLKIDGGHLYMQGTTKLWANNGSGRTRTVPPDTLSPEDGYTSGTGNTFWRTWGDVQFDSGGTTKYCNVLFRVPDDYVSGTTIDLKVIVTGGTATSAGYTWEVYYDVYIHNIGNPGSQAVEYTGYTSTTVHGYNDGVDHLTLYTIPSTYLAAGRRIYCRFRNYSAPTYNVIASNFFLEYTAEH